MKYILYCTVNTINGKIYIGVHGTFTPAKFDGYIGNGIYVNGTGLNGKSNTPFKNALSKYGTHKFRRTTLFVVDTEYEAYELEKSIVTKDFVESRNTYNATIGGKGTFWESAVAKYDLTGKLLTTYDSIDEAAKDVKVLSMYIYKASKKSSLTCNGYYWRGFDEEAVPEIKVNNASKEIQKGNRAPVPVIQYSMYGHKVREWKSAKEAAFHLHCDRATITAACRGKKKTLKNYQWRYVSDNLESLPPIETFGGKSKKIIKLDLDGRFLESYNSITEASDSVNLSRQSLHKALRLGNQSGGFLWKYV